MDNYKTSYGFNVGYAVDYGVNEAILLQNFIFWITRNSANNENFYDGHSWTFNTVNAYQELFPFLTHKQIRNAIDNLVNQGVLIKGNYNQNRYDRTNWYALKDEDKFGVKKPKIVLQSLCPTGQIELPPRANRNVQKGEPIPDITTDINHTTTQPPINNPINVEKSSSSKILEKKSKVHYVNDIGNIKLEWTNKERMYELFSQYISGEHKLVTNKERFLVWHESFDKYNQEVVTTIKRFYGQFKGWLKDNPAKKIKPVKPYINPYKEMTIKD